MAGSVSKRPYSPDKMTNSTDYSASDGKLFGDDLDDRATASPNSSEKKKRTKARHERHQSDPEEEASATPARNQAAAYLRRNDSGQESRYLSENQSKSSLEKRKTSSSLRSSSESKPSSISSGMKTGSSFLTTPEDSGLQTQDDVSKLRVWWAGLKSKPVGCGNCGSSAIFENITTDYVREQFDAEYGITISIQAAEKTRREKQVKENEIRDEFIARSRWGGGRKLGGDKDDKDDKEREKANTPSPKGKEKGKEIIESKKLAKMVGAASCPICDGCICLGCLKPLEDSQVAVIEPLNSALSAGVPDTAKPPKIRGSHLTKSKLWCCDEGRVVAIYLSLACLDEDTLGLPSGDDHPSNNSPSRKGFGGAVKRGIRSLKEKITENALQRSPGHKSKSKSKGSKGNGTGYGSGGYGNSSGLFGLDFHEPEDWEEADTSDSDDLGNDGLPFPTSFSGIMPPPTVIGHAMHPSPAIGYAPHMSPHMMLPGYAYAPAGALPPSSTNFSGHGQKLGDGSTVPAAKNDPPQTTGPLAVDYADLPMADPPAPKFSGNIGPFGRGVSATASPPWAGIHPSFSSRGRGIGKGRGGAHHPVHFLGPGQTLGGPVASGLAASGSNPKEEPFPTKPGPPPDANNPTYPLPSGWAQNFSQYPGAMLPQEVLDDLLTNALVHPGPAKSLNPSAGELGNMLEYIAPPDYSLSPPVPPSFSSMMPFIGKLRSNTRGKVIQSIPSPPPLSPEQTKHDKTLVAVMSILTELLPKSSCDSIFDLNTPPPLKIMLRTSMLVEKAEELLRNDSVQDISIHSEVYITLMGLLRRICACPDMEFLVLERRKKKLHTIGLLKITQSLPLPDEIPGSGPKTRGKIAAAAEEKRRAEVLTCAENSDRKTLIEVSANLCTQAKFFLKGAEKSQDSEFNGAEATKILGICLEIVGIREEFEKLSSRTPHLDVNSSWEEISHSKDKHLASSTPARKKAIPPQLGFEYHGPIAFEYTEKVLNTHHYRTQAHDLKQSPRGRVLHLTRELATMSTSLPQGIFVRVEDSRPDVLKALIVGPGGTPYEGGLYEFDIWAPMEYPVTPPLCIFKTTGGGSVHFNPNLYNCGKVCLSILNTWEGAASEKWQPAMSTLLQVFVSIQSMILCDNPWYNEPGRREGTQKKQSEDFNTRVKLNNVRFAMLDWIKDPEKRNGIWKDVIKAHFKENKSYLMDLIKGWGKKDASIHHWTLGMGTLYGGAAPWSEDYLMTTVTGARRLVGEAIPSKPASVDMVAEMEALITKYFEADKNED